MLQTSLGIGLIAGGSMSILAGILYGLGPLGIFGRKPGASTAGSSAPALSTRIEAPSPMWVSEPAEESTPNDVALDELFAELFSLRSQVGDLAREVRMLKGRLAALSDEDAVPTPIRRVA